MKNFLLMVFTLTTITFLNAQSVYFIEDFEGGKLPKDWQIQSVATDGGWLFGNIAALKSAGMTFTGNTTSFAATNDDKGDQKKNNELLISPKMKFVGKSPVFFSANFFFGGRTDAGIKETATVQASTDGGKNWKKVADVQPTLNDAKSAVVWGTQTFDVTSYNKDTAVWFAIQFNDNDGYLYGMGVDDVKVFTPADVDAKFKAVIPKKYAIKSTPVNVKATITNNGALPITEVEMTYKVGTTTQTKVITGLNIAPFATKEVSHPITYNYLTTGLHNFNVSMSKVNKVDATGVDSFKTIVISKNVDRKVVFEEATGTWCGWCPRGAVFMDSMAVAYKDDFIGVAVHNASTDPMRVVIYDAGLTKTPGFTGFPGVIIDRSSVIDPAQMFDKYDAARAELNPFTLNHTVTYDSITRVAKVNVKGSASMTVDGDYRFNVILSEDGVKGTAAGYAQTNYYSSTSANLDLIYGNTNYKNLANPVPAKDMVYNHVGRAILGTYAGTVGSIPKSIKEDEVYSYDYTYTVPAAMNPKNMHVVAVVLDAQTGAILTGKSTKLVAKKPGVGTNDVFVNNAVKIYPNPATSETFINVTTTENVEVTVKVFNMMGQEVDARAYGKLNGENILPYNTSNLAAGLYTVHVQMGAKLATQKLTIQ